MDRVQEAGREPAGLEQRPRIDAPPAPGLAGWASAVGNRALAGVLGRTAADGSHGSPGVPDSDFDPAKATDAERVAELRRRLAEGGGVREIWRSFADVRAAANANAELWKASVLRDPGLAEDEALLEQFRRQVEATALQHLSANRDSVTREMDELGAPGEGQEARDPGRPGALEGLQALADEVNKALQLKLVLLQIPVGFDEQPEGSFDATDPRGRQDESRPKLFEPGKPPTTPPAGQPGFQPYETVARQYAEVEKALARGMAHPALFAMVEQAGGPAAKDAHAALRTFAAGGPAAAQAQVTATLQTLLRGIESTAAQIGGAIDFRDLRPVHDVVLRMPGYAGAYERSVAEQAVAGHDTMKTLISFGLAALQAIALLSAPVLGPAALIPIVGLGVGQAAVSYDDYRRLRAARDARAGSAGAVVSDETVDAAQLQAILDGVFAFVDGVEGFAAVAKAARTGARGAAGAAKEAAEELPRLATLEPGRKDAVLGGAMATLGPGPAIDAAGGIDAVRAAAGGTPSLGRAEAFVAGLEDDVAEHLANPAVPPVASEPLLEQAAGYAARRTDVPRPRVLQMLLPRRATEAEIRELVARKAAKLAPQWAGKTPAARRELLLEIIYAESQRMKVPVPELRLEVLRGAQGSMDPRGWVLRLPDALLTNEKLTLHEYTELLATIRHEVQHAHQLVDSGRYAFFHGADPGYLDQFPADIQDAIRKRGPLAQNSHELEEAKRMYDEWGPRGHGNSLAVRERLNVAYEKMTSGRELTEQAKALWQERHGAVLAATTDEEEAERLAELVWAHREYADRGIALEKQVEEWRVAYHEYFELPTEADAKLAEQAFRADVHKRWAEQARLSTNAQMAGLAASELIFVAGVGTFGYLYYEVNVKPGARAPSGGGRAGAAPPGPR